MPIRSSDDLITKVSLVLTGPDLDPNVVTDAVGMHPTRAWKRGQARFASRPHPTYTFGLWEFHQYGPLTPPFEEQITVLLDTIEPLRDRLMPLIAQYNAEIRVWSEFGLYQVGFHLDPKMIQRLAALHLSVDMDLYPFGDDYAEDAE